MIVNKLSIAGLRVFEQAEFTFQPGMNLIVGVNGVGKSTVLDALRFCLSRIIPELTVSRGDKEPIEISDFRFNSSTLQISCQFSIFDKKGSYLIFQQRNEYVTQKGDESLEEEDKLISAPEIEDFNEEFEPEIAKLRKAKNQSIALYFSTRRSLTIEQKSSAPQSGQAAAYHRAFSINRSFNSREIADWLKAQLALAEETVKAGILVAAVEKAVATFMPGYNNLHVISDRNGVNRLMIDKNGIPLAIRQLSDGERGVLSIVAEIARRLAIANPTLENPTQEGSGVVLIDELDLHLHPRWQRTVVDNLTRTFPNCQFIVTTHSPQIISEVNPSCITIIDGLEIYQPNYSFGIDTNRVLDEIMDADYRNVKVDAILSKVFKLIDEEKLDKAKNTLDEVIEQLGENDPEVTRARTLISFLEDDDV